MRIAAAEETWPKSSPAPSEDHTDGAVGKHGSHPCHAKRYGCLRTVTPQYDRERPPQTTLSRQVVCIQSRAFFIARFPSLAVDDHHRRTWCDAANVFLDAVLEKHGEILCYYFSLYRKRSACKSVSPVQRQQRITTAHSVKHTTNELNAAQKRVLCSLCWGKCGSYDNR